MFEQKANLLKRNSFSERRYAFLSFALPVLILFLSYAVQGVFPFGDRHILTVDLYHQYAPFMVELRSKLLSFDSLFFSWSGGLGVNFFAILTYYLASPFNIVLLIFPQTMMTEAVLMMTLLKVGLGGFCFYFFLTKSYRRSGPLALALALSYALSAYVLAYSWNVMWLDTVYSLPLAALGVVKLVRGESIKFYVLSLFYLVFSNYYTAFFACLFLGLYFFSAFERFAEEWSILEFLKQLWRFSIASVLGGAMSAITLIPTIYALKLTSASGDQFPKTMELADFFIDFISKGLMFTPPAIRSGMANIYAGSYILLLLPFYFLCRKILLRRRILNLVLWAFLLLSFNLNVLSFIWHGLHYPNQLPFRFSFVYIFFVLTLIYDLLPKLSGNLSEWLPGGAVALILLLLLLQKVDAQRYANLQVLATIVSLVVFAILIGQVLNHRGISREKYTLLLCLLITIEISLNTIQTIDNIARNEYYGIRDGYSTGSEVVSVLEARRMIDRADRTSIQRMEVLPDHSVNDAMLYGTKGLTIFSSTFPKAPIALISALGYPNNGINSFQYCGSTIVMDSLLGIKHLAIRKENKLDDRTRVPTYSNSDLILYENKHALPLAYFVDSLADTFTADGTENVFSTQNHLLNTLSRSEAGSALDLISLVNPKVTGATIVAQTDAKGSGRYLYTKSQTTGTITATYSVDCLAGGNYYVAWDAGSVQPTAVYLNKGGERITLGTKTKSQNLVGYFELGAKIEIQIDFPAETSNNGEFRLMMARLDEQNFEKHIRNLADHAANVKVLSSNHLQMDVTAPRDGYVLVTTTYEPSWSVFVDGKAEKVMRLSESLMLIPVSQGQHQIEMKFVPKGFMPGLWISLGSTLLFLLIAFLPRLIKKDKKEDVSPAPHDVMDDIDPSKDLQYQYVEENDASCTTLETEEESLLLLETVEAQAEVLPGTETSKGSTNAEISTESPKGQEKEPK